MKINLLYLIMIALIISFGFTKEKPTVQYSSRSETKKSWPHFEKKYGKTLVDWKVTTQTPHRVVCHPIKLTNTIQNKGHLEQLLRDFIEDNNTIFNIENNQLKVRAIKKIRKIWYASFFQHYKGLEVLDSEIIFRVHENGQLFLFGYDYYPINSISSEVLSGERVKNRLIAQYFDENLTINQIGDLKILPLFKNATFEYKRVYQYHITNEKEHSELVYVDANTAEIIKSYNKIHEGVSGHVQGEILPITATDMAVAQNFSNLQLTIDGNTISSDENGLFDIDISNNTATLTARLRGDYVNVTNFNNPDAIITQSVQQNDVVNLTWNDSNSSMEERNVFYHINLIHAYNKQIDPNFTQLDFPLSCIVNDTGVNAPCNAFWNGTNLHFGVQAAACSINSAHGASVIYHEYGHAINDNLYIQNGVFWMKNPILQEAFSDIYATLLLNDPRFALGWFGPGTSTRNVNNNNTFPTSIVGQQHTDGLILGGAFWDLGLLTSPEKAYELAHFLKYGTPDDSDIAVAFSEVYFETLVADDDDGNLMNGTPNSTAIDDAFCQHGIGSNLFATKQLTHTVINDTDNTMDDYRIEINLTQTPFINASVDNMSLIYSANNFNSTNSVGLSTVNDTTFEAFIPAHEAGSLIKYYFNIPNGNCGTQLSHPSPDINHEYYSFRIGDYDCVFEDDFESNQNWQLNTPGDNATSGFWQRGNPQQTIDGTGFEVQPENDHSENGNNCLVTGANQNGIWYANDVDGGKTTVTSPAFTDLDETSIVAFYKWFAHGAGFIFPTQGRWKFEVSNNGSTWITIENTTFGDHKYWIKSQYKISDYTTITNQIKFRFEVSDFGSGSIVEALVDDFKILTLNSTVGTDDELQEDLINIYPNPATDVIHFDFKRPNTREITVYDSVGRLVMKTTSNDSYFDWNIEAAISDGVYFVRISTKNGAFWNGRVLVD